jgi:type I restriction enzyme R subunit
MQWRTIDGVTLDPLGQFNELETLVRGVLAPADAARLPALLRAVRRRWHGLVKKIAGYHQFHAVRAAISRWWRHRDPVAAAHPGKGGVVWHTQGSGKSITMTCFAARVMQDAAMENPTIVVITDRNDLDGQLFGVFSLAQDLLREQPVQAHTRQDLRARLGNRPSGGIVFATIQKFMPGEDEDSFPVLSERHNIVVIADEAHRTQYGFEAKLKTVRPAARFRRGRQRRCAATQRSPRGTQGGRTRRRLPDALPGRLRPAPARRAAQRHLRRLHRHAGIERRPRHARRVRRLHPRLRHAAGQGRRRDGRHLLRVAAGPAVAEEEDAAAHRRRGR